MRREKSVGSPAACGRLVDVGPATQFLEGQRAVEQLPVIEIAVEQTVQIVTNVEPAIPVRWRWRSARC